MLISFLQSKPEFTKKVTEFYKHKKTTKATALEEATEEKNATEDDRAKADQAVRNHNTLLKLKIQKDKEHKKKAENKAYSKNFWKTAKEITNGTFGEAAKTPTYDKSKGDKHYKETYETETNVNFDKLDWFPELDPPKVAYNMKAFTPADIRKALGKIDKTSAPGYDDIIYEYLMNMPYVHKVLATMFTRIQDQGIAPDIWGESKVKLIHKSGSTDQPSNFGMIALTSNIEKLYHTIEAQRTLDFMTGNNYLDPTAQKVSMDVLSTLQLCRKSLITQLTVKRQPISPGLI